MRIPDHHRQLRNTVNTPDRLTRSRFRALLLTCIVMGAWFLAQPASSQDDVGESSGERRTVIHRLEHVDATKLTPTLGMLGVRYSAQPETNSLILTGDPDAVGAASSVVKALDQPPAPKPELEIVATILDARRDTGSSRELPKHVEKAAERLGDLFGYRSYQVLDTVFLRISDGQRGGAEGGYVLDDGRLTYGLGFRARIVEGSSDNEPRSIRFSNLEFHARDPSSPRDEGRLSVALRTNVEIREGQTAIVGKATPVGSKAALVLVMNVSIDD